MGELGDLVDLLQGARERWETVRATLRERREVALMERALENWIAQGPPGSGARLEPSGESPVAPGIDAGPRHLPWEWRVWAKKPSLWRVETAAPRLPYRVEVGDRALPSEVARRDEPTLEDSLAYTFDPGILVPQLEMRVWGRTEYAGREAVRVAAVAREGVETTLIGPYADEYELLVDAERGTLLRSASKLDGEVYKATEIVSISFDERIPGHIFTATGSTGARDERTD